MEHLFGAGAHLFLQLLPQYRATLRLYFTHHGLVGVSPQCRINPQARLDLKKRHITPTLQVQVRLEVRHDTVRALNSGLSHKAGKAAAFQSIAAAALLPNSFTQLRTLAEQDSAMAMVETCASLRCTRIFAVWHFLSTLFNQNLSASFPHEG